MFKKINVPITTFFFVDQIALPDFNAGAMENWGLITYRETALLYDPKISAAGNKQRVATVVAHELAHMVISQKRFKYSFLLTFICMTLIMWFVARSGLEIL